MAFEVDLDSIDDDAKGTLISGNPTHGTSYDPIRRKMHVNLNQ